jgi:hypothetical protein
MLFQIVRLQIQPDPPVHLTIEMLTKRANLTLDWEEERALLGFD